MAILKLANAGDEATLEINNVEVVQGQYGEQVKFTSGDDILFLPKDSAVRQLERLGLVLADAVDETLVFSRTPSTKPGSKPFWNINRATNGKPPVSKAAPPKSAPAKQPISYSSVADKDLPEFLRSQESEDNAALAAKIGVDLSGIQRDLAIYQAQTEFVLREIAPLYDKAGIGMSPESAAACVQTLFINSTGGKK